MVYRSASCAGTAMVAPPEQLEITIEMRNLVLVLGDQLDAQSAAFDGFEHTQDAVLMIEAREEANYIPQHHKRLVFFFSAMRHFRDALRAANRKVHYSELTDPANLGCLADECRRHFVALQPRSLIVLEPGDWRVRQSLLSLRLPVEIRRDRHYLCSLSTFNEFAARGNGLVLEQFYRFMRRRLNIMVDGQGKPRGGQWNYDKSNRRALPASGLAVPRRMAFPPDATTRSVIQMVVEQFPDAPGRSGGFDYPVERDQALAALADFVENRLAHFGLYQDAMSGDHPFLFHSVISGALNVHLLNPREVVQAVLHHASDAPINSVEGFVRQVIGWREYVRGVYWRAMPHYAEMNALEAHLPMPRFYWTGKTNMECLARAIGHTIDHAYAHHIERLMILGLFAMLLGVNPYEVHRWHMSMFWDAIDWVSLPNTLGMSQYGDGGLVGTKPYAASGNYINRMSNHCSRCRYDPKKATGDEACPFTTLYWDFLQRHRNKFANNMRMRHQYANLARKSVSEIAAIRRQADQLKANLMTETL